MTREPLSPRERAVLYLIARGHSNKQIAQQLFRSTKTIEKHRQSIYYKWNVRSETALVRVALRTGEMQYWDFISSREGENCHHAIPGNQVRIINRVKKRKPQNENDTSVRRLQHVH